MTPSGGGVVLADEFAGGALGAEALNEPDAVGDVGREHPAGRQGPGRKAPCEYIGKDHVSRPTGKGMG